MQALAEAQDTVRQEAERARGPLAQAQAATVARLDALKARWLPTVHKFDAM